MIPFFMVFVLLSLQLQGCATSGNQQTQTVTPIKHVIVITMENHSLDNIFGNYPDGGASNLTYLTNYITRPDDISQAPLRAFLKQVPQNQFSTPDPIEGYTAYHLDWNNGMMNDFLNNSGPQSMTYFTAAQMAPEWVLAQEFSMGDMYFSSSLSETIPNRLYEISGYSPVINDYGMPPYVLYSQTIFGELSVYGISWAYYVYGTQQSSLIPPFIKGFPYAGHLQTWGELVNEIENGTLPAVSYISPIGGGASGYSQHPSDNMIAGEMFLLYIVNRVMMSPVWNSTAIFINYDEGGGYYDHVPPPVVDGHRLGFRVPLILISPYAKEDYVSNTVMNHASIIAFIDYNWNLPPLNSFVAHSNLPLDMFYFSYRRPAFPLKADAGFPVPATIYFNPYKAPESSLASLFPYKFQIAPSTLPYALSGNSSLNLSSMKDAYYVRHDVSYTPLFQSIPFLLLLTGIILLATYAVTAGRR